MPSASLFRKLNQFLIDQQHFFFWQFFSFSIENRFERWTKKYEPLSEIYDVFDVIHIYWLFLLASLLLLFRTKIQLYACVSICLCLCVCMWWIMISLNFSPSIFCGLVLHHRCFTMSHSFIVWLFIWIGDDSISAHLISPSAISSTHTQGERDKWNKCTHDQQWIIH